jgi:hypothetical protein
VILERPGSGSGAELRVVRRIRWRMLLAILLIVVTVEVVSSFAWSRYRGPAVLPAGTPNVVLPSS